ncbi:MAG: hypothetical protein IT368_08070 [Candidatus Hydrogenedentes bacterium]|nr:hypothetical protein [Candidatus Hydrogenedentota bacterium]
MDILTTIYDTVRSLFITVPLDGMLSGIYVILNFISQIFLLTFGGTGEPIDLPF